MFAITKLQSKRPDGIPTSRSISLIFKTNDDCHGNWSCSVYKGVAGVVTNQDLKSNFFSRRVEKINSLETTCNSKDVKFQLFSNHSFETRL